MKSLKLMLIAAVVAAIGFAATAGGVSGTARSLRWDLVHLNLNAMPLQAVPGGTVTSKDEATGDTVSLTGSGQFTPSRRIASGGGTIVHKKADGTLVGEGYYYVTKFVSFRTGGGEPPKIVDRVTGRAQGSPLDGILRLRVKTVPVVDGKPQAAHNGTLTIYCHFEHNKIGVKESDEGFTLSVDNFRFKQTPMGGFTVFHRLR
jgi:hypothetical protein